MRRRNAVPLFGVSEMQIVDRKEVHILHMPSERGLPHAKVQHGNRHTGKIVSDEVQDRA